MDMSKTETWEFYLSRSVTFVHNFMLATPLAIVIGGASTIDDSLITRVPVTPTNVTHIHSIGTIEQSESRVVYQCTPVQTGE
jgi:hypothetical protein